MRRYHLEGTAKGRTRVDSKNPPGASAAPKQGGESAEALKAAASKAARIRRTAAPSTTTKATTPRSVRGPSVDTSENGPKPVRAPKTSTAADSPRARPVTTRRPNLPASRSVDDLATNVSPRVRRPPRPAPVPAPSPVVDNEDDWMEKNWGDAAIPEPTPGVADASNIPVAPTRSSPPFVPPRRVASPAAGFPSSGAAELAAYLSSGDDGLKSPGPQASVPTFVAAPQRAPGGTGPSRALLGIALLVVMATVACVVYVVGDRQGSETVTTAPGDPALTATTAARQGTAFSTLWKVDGYSLVDAPPSMVADLRAARDELLPSMRGAFRDTQVRKVELGGRPVGYAVAHTLDPIVVDDAAFTGFMMKAMSPALSGPIETTVGGHTATYGRYDNFSGFITIKKDVLLFVIGVSRVTIEPLLAELLANIV